MLLSRVEALGTFYNPFDHGLNLVHRNGQCMDLQGCIVNWSSLCLVRERQPSA